MNFEQILRYLANQIKKPDILFKYFILFLINDTKNISNKDQIRCIFKYSNILIENPNIMSDIQNLDDYQLKLLLNISIF